MKIAFVPSTFLPWIGGAEIQTHNMANKMVEIGNTVDVLLLKKVKLNNNSYNIVKLNHIFINLIFIFKYYFNLDFTFLLKKYFNNICKNKKYDVWHFHSVNYKTLLYIKPLKDIGEKIFLTFQGADIQKDVSIKYGYRFDKKYEKLLSKNLKYVDKVFTISKDIERELDFFSFPKNKISHIPNSVELKKINKIAISKKKDEKLRIITVARYYEKKKGLDMIEEVSKEFIKNNYNFEWTLAGRNSNQLMNKNFIKQNIKYFNLVDEIKNIDEIYFPHSKLLKLYKDHDVYVNLARVESFGITIIEAIASGLPVLSFDTKGANELVLDNINGYLIKNYNPKEMADFLMSKFNLFFKGQVINTDMIKKFDLELNSKQTLINYKK